MSNSNVYNAISMSVSTMGYGANANSSLLKFNVDGNTVFNMDTFGDITANTIIVNTILANNSANGITTGALTSNNIIANNITANSISANVFHSPGSVIQVVQVVKTDIFTTTSTTPVDVTGLTANITPLFATSKILVIVDLSWTSSGHSDAYLIRNGATKLFYGDLYGLETQSSLHQYYNPYGQAYGHICYLDSPATTSITNYKIQVASPYAAYTIAVNYMYTNPNASYSSRVPSSITLMEIAQ